jgi:hypothetical protein
MGAIDQLHGQVDSRVVRALKELEAEIRLVDARCAKQEQRPQGAQSQSDTLSAHASALARTGEAVTEIAAEQSSLKGEIKRLSIELAHLEQRVPVRPAALDGLPESAESNGEDGAKVRSPEAPFFGLDRTKESARFMTRPSRWVRFWCWLLRLPVPSPKPSIVIPGVALPEGAGLKAWSKDK